MSIDPNFHFYLEQLALGDQKRTTPKILNFLKRVVEEEKPENHLALLKIIKEYQKILDVQDAEENALLALVILEYLKNHVDALKPTDYERLKKIKQGIGKQFSKEQKEEFDLYMEAAKVSKVVEKLQDFD
jgi:hypothetical protein